MVRSAYLLLLAQPLGSLLQCFCFLHTAVPDFGSFELTVVVFPCFAAQCLRQPRTAL